MTSLFQPKATYLSTKIKIDSSIHVLVCLSKGCSYSIAHTCILEAISFVVDIGAVSAVSVGPSDTTLCSGETTTNYIMHGYVNILYSEKYENGV